MKNRLLIMSLLSLLLVACGGGGGSSGGGTPDIKEESSTAVLPLKITVLDLNDNPVSYMDLGKIGSHPVYKIKFTNINTKTINLRFDSKDNPDYYAYAQAQKLGMTVESYYANYGAGSFNRFLNTGKPDDCISKLEELNNPGMVPYTTLAPNASCSFYSVLVGAPGNFTNKEVFTIPINYSFYIPGEANSRVNVVQCTRVGGTPIDPVVDCSNMTKPGFSEQFISYKALPFTGTTNLKGIPTISRNGNWAWECGGDNCSQYAINYNSITNTLTQSAIPTANMNLAMSSGQRIRAVYPSIDGSNAWVSTYSSQNGYYLVNTQMPDIEFTGDCFNSKHCVPYIFYYDVFARGVTGLDGSFWWQGTESAVRYDPKAQTFILTNIPGVLGVNADGTIIGGEDGQLACYNSSNNLTTYTKRSALLNYVKPNEGTRIDNYANNVYITMPIDGLYDYQGRKLYELASFKIHTENGLCQVNPDDYTYYTGYTDQYYLAGPDGYTTPYVISAANVYSGL